MILDRRRFLAGAAALAAVPPVSPRPDRFAGRAITADLAVVREAYDRLHPGLTRYLPTGGFDRLVARATDWARPGRTPAETYLMLARLTAAVRCGHSHANPANQRRRVQQELIGRADRLPFCTTWRDARMIVTDPLDASLPRGTEVLAVDGVPAARLLAEMLPLTRADGHNDAKRVAQLELHRADRYAAFDVFRTLLHPTPRAGEVRLCVRRPGGAETMLTFATAAEGRRGTAAAADPQYGWRFAIDADGVGVLTMPDWSLYDSKWDWRGFLDGVADELIAARARGLVVDLRENEGGLDCGDVLLERLVARPVAPPPGRRLVRFRETPAALRPLLDTWDPSFHTLGAEAVPVRDRPGFLDLGAAESRAIAPRGRRFAGPLVVLVGPTCSSATFGFAEMVQRERLGTIVGAPTGGNRRGINGGCYFFVRLPETGLEVDLPLIGYFPDAAQPDRGVLPDVAVAATLADIAAGRDPALERARGLARSI